MEKPSCSGLEEQSRLAGGVWERELGLWEAGRGGTIDNSDKQSKHRKHWRPGCHANA